MSAGFIGFISVKGGELSAQQLKNYLGKLQAVAQQDPQPGSVALLIDASVCGHVSPQAFEVISRRWANHVTPAGIQFTSAPDLTAQLEPVARALFEAGCATRWRNEPLDLWCDGNAVGAIERGVVRALGVLTRAVHLNAWSSAGHLWVARRALDKATDPGLWDTLVGGLVGHGEPDDLALERETQEEAGLNVQQIAKREPLRSVYRMRRQVPEGFQYEEVLTADCVLDDSVTPQNQDGEVMQIACLPPEKVQAMLLEGLFTVEAGIVIAQSLLQRSSR